MRDDRDRTGNGTEGRVADPVDEAPERPEAGSVADGTVADTVEDEVVPEAVAADAVPDNAEADNAEADNAEADNAEADDAEARADEPGPADPVPPEAPEPAGSPEPASGWKRVAQLLRPRGTRSELLTGLLCLALGFALAVQVGQSTGDQLSSLRQDELVRLLDEVTQRADQLDAEVSDLEEIRDDLQSEDGRDQAARDLAQQRAEQEGILSGRLPAQGPGVQIHVADGDRPLEAQALFNLLEELRNAGAEAIELNGSVRVVAQTSLEDGDDGIVVDGQRIAPPYTIEVVGDPGTLSTALTIPGGFIEDIEGPDVGGGVTVEEVDEVEIASLSEPREPEYAEPVESE